MKSPRIAAFGVALAIGVVAAMRAAEPVPAAMAVAAGRFLGSLTADQRGKAVFPFESDERVHWHFIPTAATAPGFPRHGLTLGEMNASQQNLARELLKTGMSARGYLTATDIMNLEDVLRGVEEAEYRVSPPRGMVFVRDPARYFFSVFGTPSATGTWEWRVEGHHVSLHFTVVNGAVTVSTPSFFGSNPAEVKDGPKKGLRILAGEEDTARSLVMSLTETQRAKAVIDATAPGDILTTNRFPIDPLSPVGLAAADMTAAQRDQLMRVIDTYVSLMANDISALRMSRLRKSGLENIVFAWAGDTQRGKKHYYRIQGPTFLIEYDNTQNDGNHVHSVWRDFNGDFGRDLLREHLASGAH